MLSAFRNLRISLKLMLPLGILALVGAGTGGYASRTLMATDAAYTELLARDIAAEVASVRMNQLTVDLSRAAWRAVARPEAEVIAQSMRDVEAMEAVFAAEAAHLRPVVAGTPHAADLATVEREFPAMRTAVLRSLRELQAGRAEDAGRILNAEIHAQMPAARGVIERLTATLRTTADTRSATLTEATHAAVWAATAVLVLGIALSLAIGIWLTLAAVVRPLGRLDRGMQRLAAGDLETAIADTARGDEIGAMARALQGFATGLREAQALRDGQASQEERSGQDRKAALVAMAGSLEQGVGQVVQGIAAAAAELTTAANSMVGIAESTTSRCGIVSTATMEASSNVNTVAAATEELAASVGEISRQIADSARMAGAAVDQANRTTATVANLTEAAARIGEVTRLIGDIAGQTNLLALNATIEAARAGEAGKGFAVVASEVKALANQTAQATGNIATQIQAMQAATREAATDIGAIRDSIGQINEVTAAIAAAVEEQGAATREIAQNVQRAAVGTNEIANAIDGVTTAAGETGGAAGQVQTTSGTLASQAEALRREVDDFLGRVRAA